MSQLSRGILAAIAISLAGGAVQYASGRDLSAVTPIPDVTPVTSINREVKTDRAAAVARPGVEMQTISIRPYGLSDTSVLVRVPIAQAGSHRGSSTPSMLKPGDRRMTVACEPVVSVLTEIAKRLQPGRCVT
jgi:hypothetical protein